MYHGRQWQKTSTASHPAWRLVIFLWKFNKSTQALSDEPALFVTHFTVFIEMLIGYNFFFQYSKLSWLFCHSSTSPFFLFNLFIFLSITSWLRQVGLLPCHVFPPSSTVCVAAVNMGSHTAAALCPWHQPSWKLLFSFCASSSILLKGLQTLLLLLQSSSTITSTTSSSLLVTISLWRSLWYLSFLASKSRHLACSLKDSWVVWALF